ncbi:aquaporin 9 [Angomonas deanei]|uniref:Major intrinsic protein, putative n=1 Tax=Angomonas deanei TaxID=59799 RepID=A0A7G2C8I2_9TRYP|nr:aquaporin 9 [Angomonas deanei]CAD2216170.1 Major intrinsic protein, putative [Angomonas deanei]|eukprot:EPY27197.1 aquaporin 9 [Angomonas deanei]
MTCVTIGFMFTAIVFTLAYVSGGHFNPAISVAVFMTRNMELITMLGYIIAQICAAVAAGFVAMLLQSSGSDIYVPYVEEDYVSKGIFSELIFTLAIVLVVLNIGYSRQKGNFFYGFAIGMCVTAGSACVGHVSGGSFNPAASTGLQLAQCITGDCEAIKSFWVYWLAP